MTSLRQKLLKAADLPLFQKISAFLDGTIYPAVYAALMLVCSLFGLEFFCYALTTAIVVYVCLFAKDTRAILPPAVLVVYSMSWKHTSQPPYRSDFLNGTAFLVVVAVLGTCILAAMILRVFLFREKGSLFRFPSMGAGLALLCLSFLTNGVFSSEFVSKDILLGFLIAFSFGALFFFFSATLKRNFNYGLYFAYILFLASAVIFLQVVKLLVFGHTTAEGHLSVFDADGSINKDLMIAGWGMSNNVGGMLAMFLPAQLYLAAKVRRGYLFYLFAFLQLGAVCATLSRSSLLFGGAMLLAGAILLSVVKTPYRKFFRIFNLAVLVCGVIFCAVFWDKIVRIFSVIFERGFSDSQRFEIWKNGLLNFLKDPPFGVGFYAPFYVDINIENWFFPDMYHNIFVQILASCGLFGIFAYAYHLSQVLNLAIRKVTAERIFFLAVFLMLSGTSLLDNHLFHVFPALVYSIVLCLWERDARKDLTLQKTLLAHDKNFPFCLFSTRKL